MEKSGVSRLRKKCMQIFLAFLSRTALANEGFAFAFGGGQFMTALNFFPVCEEAARVRHRAHSDSSRGSLAVSL